MIKNENQVFRPQELVASMSSLVQRVRLRDVIEVWQQGRLMEATDENAYEGDRDSETRFATRLEILGGVPRWHRQEY